MTAKNPNNRHDRLNTVFVGPMSDGRMLPHGRMPFSFLCHKGMLYGGPYKNRPESMVGIKMAEEINLPCDFDVPTRDFDVPSMPVLLEGLEYAMVASFMGDRVYVGCMGGIGRTGLFMAAMAKVCGVRNPVEYVREHYKPHAVETADQKRYIKSLPVWKLRFKLAWCRLVFMASPG